MKKILKYLGYLVVVLVLCVSALLLYVRMALPNVPAEDITIEYTEARIQRGEYLAKYSYSMYGLPLYP
jgi:hypothetical protein